jgi:hypothetical protein
VICDNKEETWFVHYRSSYLAGTLETLEGELKFHTTANTYKAAALTYWAVSLAFLDLFGI